MLQSEQRPHLSSMKSEKSVHSLSLQTHGFKPPRAPLAEGSEDNVGHQGKMERQSSVLTTPLSNKYNLPGVLCNDSISNCGSEGATSTMWRMMDFGVSAEQGTRKTMEDKHTMLAEGIPFFGVYDGHGGTGCAEYLRDNLHRLILSHPEVKTQPDKALREGILEADRAFLKKCEAEQTDSGCVCAVVLLVGDKLVVGNVGDTEIVLCRDGKATALTTKHSPKFDPTEADRIRAVGGKMIGHRVAHPKFNGRACSLAVSRAIGDATFKLDSYTGGQPSGIIAEPYTTVRRITPQDEFLVIGCDGLWDVLTHQEVVDICRQCDDDGATPHMITEALVDEAMLRGSTDNVTVAFVSIQSIPHGDLSRNRSSAFSISRKGSDCYSMSGK